MALIKYRAIRDFPVGLLRPLPGHFIARSGEVSIEIPLAPFILDGETIETTIYLGNVSLPAADVLKLAGQTFPFPVNPHPGYIDGGVYVQHAHQPIDVTALRFGNEENKTVAVELDLSFVFKV